MNLLGVNVSCIWTNIRSIGPESLCFVSIFSYIWSACILRSDTCLQKWPYGSPSQWTGQIDSFVQTFHLDLVLERTRCDCFCRASTVIRSTMGRTMTEIRDISERLTATGERLIGPRGPISIPTPVFFVSLFLFLSRNLLFILSLSWLFFFFQLFSSPLSVLLRYVQFIGSGKVPNLILRGSWASPLLLSLPRSYLASAPALSWRRLNPIIG